MFQYSFSSNTSMGGFSFVRQQVHPHVIHVMHVANSDPLVSAYCRSKGITDAHVLYNELLEYGKLKYVEKTFKLVTADEYARLEKEHALDPELFPDPEPEPTSCSDMRKLTGGEFECFHVIDSEHINDANRSGIRYQCQCGLIVFGVEPEGNMSTHHYGSGGYSRKRMQDLPTIKRKTTVTWKQEVVEAVVTGTSDDGVPVYEFGVGDIETEPEAATETATGAGDV